MTSVTAEWQGWREPCNLEINTVVSSVLMAVYRFVLGTARLPQKEQASNEGVKKRRAILQDSVSLLFFLSGGPPLCTASGVIPFSTAVMQGSVLRAQPQLPQFAAQKGHLSRLSVDPVCVCVQISFCV